MKSDLRSAIFLTYQNLGAQVGLHIRQSFCGTLIYRWEFINGSRTAHVVQSNAVTSSARQTHARRNGGRFGAFSVEWDHSVDQAEAQNRIRHFHRADSRFGRCSHLSVAGATSAPGCGSAYHCRSQLSFLSERARGARFQCGSNFNIC